LITFSAKLRNVASSPISPKKYGFSAISIIQTLAPAFLNYSAMHLPMPPAPPVITTTLSLNIYLLLRSEIGIDFFVK
ncbi:MAG: hypothetical protein IIU54_03090, partial [Phascolarctobacterium sp.]|nr:hypothetical protein [Phascolarctobacterium sp.]